MKIRLLLSIAAISIGLVVIACGGGGGGGSSTSSSSTSNSTVLSSSVGSLTASHLTVGDPAQFSGGTTLAENFKSLLKGFYNWMIPSAIAQTVSACSSNTLIGSSNNSTWNIIGLTGSNATPPCVNRIQDAGRYIVLKVTGITDSGGNTCDLVAIQKSSGQTTCINVPLPNRATTGDPDFYLGLTNYFPAELTLNGNYFTIGFYTGQQNSSAYAGFLRLDLSGSTPTSAIAYMEYGSASSTFGNTTVNNHNLFWGEFWPQENGDLIFTQFTPTSKSGGTQYGIASHYYLVVNPALLDPTKAMAVLYNQNYDSASRPSDVAQSYTSDIVKSPVGSWFKSKYADTTQIIYNSEVMPNPFSSASEHSFFIQLNNDSALHNNLCGNITNGLIKGIINASTGAVSFQDYGGTGIGAGWGAHTRTSNIILDNTKQNFVTLKWRPAPSDPSNQTLDVVKLVRSITPMSCDQDPSSIYTESMIPGTVVSGSVTTNGYASTSADVPFTYETSNSIFMMNFDAIHDAQQNCLNNNGSCPIPASSKALVYDKITGVVTSIALSPLMGSNYYVTREMSSITSSRVYMSLIDNSQSPAPNIYAELTPTGFQNIIKLPPAVKLSQFMISGN